MTAIGSLGIAKCGDLRKITMGFTTFLAILTILLIIVALAGWTTDGASLKQISWGKIDFTALGGSGTKNYTILIFF